MVLLWYCNTGPRRGFRVRMGIRLGSGRLAFGRSGLLRDDTPGDQDLDCMEM